MSQITSYSALYPDLILDLPGASADLLLHALQRAGRQFAQDSKAFRIDLDPLPVVNYQRDYDLNKGKTHAYDADILQLLGVRINGTVQPMRAYSLYESRWLRLGFEVTPQSLDEDRLLVCGTAGKTVVADWTGVTDGSVVFDVDGSTYEADKLDFAWCASMDDVARVIETGWRAAWEYPRAYVRWAEAGTNKFLIWSDSGEISYCTAGTSGTDISGAAYMNALTGGTGVTLGPLLEVEAALLPHMRTDVLPDFFLERHGSTIVALAAWMIARVRGNPQSPNPFYNPELAAARLFDYQNGLQEARGNNTKQDRDLIDRLL